MKPKDKVNKHWKPKEWRTTTRSNMEKTVESY